MKKMELKKLRKMHYCKVVTPWFWLKIGMFFINLF